MGSEVEQLELEEQEVDNPTDDLNAAWDAIESEEPKAKEPKATEQEAEEPILKKVDESFGGQDTPKPDKKAAVEDDDKPPVGLPAEAREAWKDTPKAVREALAKREKDFATGIQQYATAAKRANDMDKVLTPFSQYVSMNGGPSQAITRLLQTGSQLQMGAPLQKAQGVAQLIQQFGVDIDLLSGELAGVQQRPQELSVQEQVQAALQPLMQERQQAQHYQQQQHQQRLMGELQQFQSDPNHEFYPDVRAEMADILDLAANRGINMTLEDAYNKACALTPSVAKIIDSRKNLGNVNQRRTAASSIRGNPGGALSSAQPDSMRAAIESAWDGYGRE